MKEKDFVSEAILELLRDNRVEEIFSPPDIVDPLTVLDLRHINLHFCRQEFNAGICIPLRTLLLTTILSSLLI